MELTIGWKRLVPLTLGVVTYLCIGAVIFQHLEGTPEIDRRNGLRELIKTFIHNHTCINKTDLQKFLDAVGSEYEFAQGTLLNKSVSTRWDFAGAFSFVVTVVTTIGYGNLAPHTEVGKLTLIVYALFGIPLMFLMLQGFGQHLTILSNKVNGLKLCSKRPAVNKYLNMVLIILLGVSFLFAGPTVLFMYVEGWTLMEGLYYCFVTLSTIGFGDYITALTENRFSGPGSGDAGTIYRIVAYVWIVLGLAYVALIINYISNVLVRKAEKMEKMSKARIEAEIKVLQAELSKTKSQFVNMAESMADSVVNQVNQVKNRDSSRKPSDEETGNQSIFKNKKKTLKKSETVPVQLLSYSRRHSLGS